MTEPKIAQKAPYEIELEPGSYWWCRCGRSATQPLCDGSHKGTGFEPVEFTVTEPQKLWLCGCKQTLDPPHCDGTHGLLED